EQGLELHLNDKSESENQRSEMMELRSITTRSSRAYHSARSFLRLRNKVQVSCSLLRDSRKNRGRDEAAIILTGRRVGFIQRHEHHKLRVLSRHKSDEGNDVFARHITAGAGFLRRA